MKKKSNQNLLDTLRFYYKFISKTKGYNADLEEYCRRILLKKLIM